VTTGRVALALLAAGGIALAAQAADGPRVDGAAALRHVERLVAIGPRVAGTAGGERARAYITGELRKLGVTFQVRPFDADTPHGRRRMANVVAMVPGRRRDVILLGGHYDTKRFEEFRFVGANDGGSSAGLLVELTPPRRESTRTGWCGSTARRPACRGPRRTASTARGAWPPTSAATAVCRAPWCCST
jgi:hypothetical protein